MAKVFPVIHHLDRQTTIEQARLAHAVDADGVFLISHNGKNGELGGTALRIKDEFPGWKVGVNYLGWNGLQALRVAAEHGADMLWIDAPGITGAGLTEDGVRLANDYGDMLWKGRPELFGSVAFKYQPHEPHPASAAMMAHVQGYIPTTSGNATGVAPDLEKIKLMKAGVPRLAIASGMTVENVAAFVPYLTHILVATGVSEDEHHFDFEKLSAFIGKVRTTAKQQ